jgi:GLPGLI family protein
MKKSSSLLLITILFTALSGFSAPKTFEGVITYKISYPGNQFTESQLSMFPKLLIVTVKGEKSRSEIMTPMGNQVDITDYAAKTKVGLFDIMGQKYAIKSTEADIQKEMATEPKGTVELSAETKMIAGYLCKKAVITVDEKGSKYSFDVYYTNELGPKEANFSNPTFKDIDGVLMEFSMKTEQFNMKFTATSVEKKAVSPKDFEIPADYTITTEEEFQSKFGGMGQ